MSPHKVQIKFCCVASFFPPPFPSDVFITKPNVCLESAKRSQERESLKQNVHIRVKFPLPSGRSDWTPYPLRSGCSSVRFHMIFSETFIKHLSAPFFNTLLFRPMLSVHACLN